MITRSARALTRRLPHLVCVAVAFVLTTAEWTALKAHDQVASGSVEGLPSRWLDLPESPFHVVVSNGRPALINRSSRTFRYASVGCVKGERLVEVVGLIVAVGNPNGWQRGAEVNVFGAALELERDLANPDYRRLFPNRKYCADDLRVAVIHATGDDGYEWSAAGTPWPPGRTATPKHFIFFGRDRQRISEPAFLENTHVTGAQLKYTWRELEPERDRYELQPLLDDLAFLEKHGKRLFVQLQDVSFSEEVLIPDYLRTDPLFGGGVARKYEYEGDDESKAHFDGWVARRWDPAVRARFIRLLEVLGTKVDGRIEGVNLSETSIGFGESGTLHPKGFTYESYVEGVKATMAGARSAFPRSSVIQYANFMPGEWLPGTDHGYLRAVYAWADRIGVGVGGPDLLPHRKGQQNHSYPLIAARGQNTPAGVAVQDGNLKEINPSTGKRVTVAELYAFATTRLRLDYIFWGTEEPYYSAEILPYLRGLGPQ